MLPLEKQVHDVLALDREILSYRKICKDMRVLRELFSIF